MQRRTFLKLAATTTVAASARVAFPWAAAAANQPVSYAGSLWRAGGYAIVWLDATGAPPPSSMPVRRTPGLRKPLCGRIIEV